MSPATPRFAPRSAVSAADHEPLKSALVELDAPAADPAATVRDVARRIAGFVAERRVPAVRSPLVDLGSIGVATTPRPTQT